MGRHHQGYVGRSLGGFLGEWGHPTWGGGTKLGTEETCEPSQGVSAGQEDKGVGGIFGVLMPRRWSGCWEGFVA